MMLPLMPLVFADEWLGELPTSHKSLLLRSNHYPTTGMDCQDSTRLPTSRALDCAQTTSHQGSWYPHLSTDTSARVFLGQQESRKTTGAVHRSQTRTFLNPLYPQTQRKTNHRY